MAWFTLESIFVLLGDSFPWDMLGIKCYCFIVVFLISIVSILLDHWYCTLHILIDVHCIVFVSPLKSHIFCHCKEMSSLKHGHFFNRKKEPEVDLHG